MCLSKIDDLPQRWGVLFPATVPEDAHLRRPETGIVAAKLFRILEVEAFTCRLRDDQLAVDATDGFSGWLDRHLCAGRGFV
jgi:hypothetical protein